MTGVLAVMAMNDLPSCRGLVASPVDVERMRREARALAVGAGFAPHDAETIVLVVSELGTNLLRYAPGGELFVSVVAEADAAGIVIQSRGAGPGIADVARAFQDGFSTGGGLGSGLPAVRRLMDRVTIKTSPAGTLIEAWKWAPPPSRLA